MNSTSAGTQTGFPCRCVRRSNRSRTRTCQPAASAASTMWEPIRPAPPVTSAVVGLVIRSVLTSRRSKRPPRQARVSAHEPRVNPPNPPGRDDGENDERDVLVRLFEQPAVAGEVDSRQEELLPEVDQGGESRRQPQDEESAGTELGQGHDPLEETPVLEHDVVDEAAKTGNLRPLRRGLRHLPVVDLEVEDAPR